MKILWQRNVWLCMIFSALFFCILWRMFDIQIINSTDYLDALEEITTRKISTDAPRGRIYDTNGEILADTQEIYYAVIRLRDMPSDSQEKNKIIHRLIELFKDNEIQIKVNFPIKYDGKCYSFDGDEQEINKLKSNIFVSDNDDKLSNAEKEMDADQLMSYLCGKSFFNIKGYTSEQMLEIAAIRYILYMYRYYPDTNIQITNELSENGIACISEYQSSLPGILLEKGYKRVYPDSKYFSNITGYTGLISTEEYNKYSQGTYELTDNIGKTGIEQTFENELKGRDGCYIYDVSYDGSQNNPRLASAPEAGSDMHLSIDKNLQMKIFDLIEEKIAGILLSRFFMDKPADASDSDWIYTTDDIICALKENKMISNDEYADFINKDPELLYQDLYDKIQRMEITPDMLGLYPCSAACIVTEVKTGKVKALVSYPGYDANQISNGDYYASLLQLHSLPMFDRTRQMTMAPGSIYKMITAAAALEEGIITPETKIYDELVFKKISPGPSCWSSLSHGAVNVKQALAASCNFFFYNIGYDMSLSKEGKYISQNGLAILKKYSHMFGLDELSGIELGESKSSLSDDNAVLSAIGQGSHNYTPIVLARYITSLANRGKVYQLSLIDNSIQDSEAFMQDNNHEQRQVCLSDTTWHALLEGMSDVCNLASYKDIFTSLPFECAGKSGTVQVSQSEPDHGLFAGFAPFDDPEYAVTVIIPNGYTSNNTVDVFRDIIALCYDLPLYDEIHSESDKSERQASMPYNYTDQRTYFETIIH